MAAVHARSMATEFRRRAFGVAACTKPLKIGLAVDRIIEGTGAGGVGRYPFDASSPRRQVGQDRRGRFILVGSRRSIPPVLAKRSHSGMIACGDRFPSNPFSIAHGRLPRMTPDALRKDFAVFLRATIFS